MIYTAKLGFVAGTDISTAAKTAIEIAARFDINLVSFDFNGSLIFVNKYMTVLDVETIYRTLVK